MLVLTHVSCVGDACCSCRVEMSWIISKIVQNSESLVRGACWYHVRGMGCPYHHTHMHTQCSHVHTYICLCLSSHASTCTYTSLRSTWQYAGTPSLTLLHLSELTTLRAHVDIHTREMTRVMTQHSTQMRLMQQAYQQELESLKGEMVSGGTCDRVSCDVMLM